MGFYIGDTQQAAATIKKLGTELGWNDIRVRVRARPALIQLDLLEESAYGPIAIAGFTLVEQINCCGIMVSTRTYVRESHRGQHIAQDMMPLKEAIAREYGYSQLMATVNITGNPAEVHILEKSGWTMANSFVNKRTKNTVGIFVKNLG